VPADRSACGSIRFPLVVMTPSVQLDAWASSPIYLFMGGLLSWAVSCWGGYFRALSYPRVSRPSGAPQLLDRASRPIEPSPVTGALPL